MVDFLAVLSLAVSIVPTLEKKVTEHLKNKEVKRALFEVLEIRITSYMQSYEKLIEVPQKMIPLLDPLEYREATPSDINNLRKISAELAYAYSDWIESFISLSKAMKVLKETNPAFMHNLKTYNLFLHDFVIQIAALTKGNRLVVTESLYLFTTLHKKELKNLYSAGASLAIDEAGKDLKIVKIRLAPMRNTPVAIEIEKQYLDAIKQFRKANQKVIISKEYEVNLQEYMLPSLKPLMQILKEIV